MNSKSTSKRGPALLAFVVCLSMLLASLNPTLAAPPAPLELEPATTTPVKIVGEKSAPDELALYIVKLKGESLASYEGGVAGLPATSPRSTGAAKLDVKSAASVAYLNYLADQHAAFVSKVESQVGRSVNVSARYDAVLNGIAVELTGAEVEEVAKLPEVVFIQRNGVEYPQTDAGPEWIGAPAIWEGTATGGVPGTRGEGVIVGVLDTGINHDHPSFADIGGDGYDHTNPFGSGTYVGYCEANPTYCNDKLIGAWDIEPNGSIGSSPEDDNGHGSHTASTAAGNVLFNALLVAPTIEITFDEISGVAPHANLITYRVCDGGCANAQTIAGTNQAVMDGVDVINYSIGGGAQNPWGDAGALAFLDARAAGVFVATSAGNSGPGPGTVGSPNVSPWMLAVGASTHNRKMFNSVVDLSGGNTPPPADIVGEGVTEGYGPAPIVYAGAAPYNDPLCRGTVRSGYL